MNYKLSQLPVAATVADDDMIYIVQGGTSKQVSLGALREQADGWQRTSDWLAMPVTATNTINILVAVYDTDSNFVALQCNTSSGTYHVDWGDGTNADFASGTPAEHVYTFGSLSGSWSTRGYNQALIEVSGAITTIDLGVRHSSVSVNYTQPFLDLQINCPSCVSLAIRSTVVPYSLERCDIVAIGSITTTSGMFNSCYSLVTVSFPVGSLGSVTDMSNMFLSCHSLESVTFPTGTLAAVTTANSTFNSCSSLVSVSFPTGSLAALTSANSMFTNCHNLKTTIFPSGSLSGVSDSSSMFGNCYSLESVTFPVGSLASVTNAGSMFINCYHLNSITIPTGAFALTTICSSMFSGCRSLVSVVFPAGALGLATATTGMFASCYSLESVTFPSGALALTTNLSTLFSNCYALRSVTFPTGSLVAVTNISSMFNNCYSLKSVSFPTGSLSAVTNTSDLFSACTSLSAIVNCLIPTTFRVANGVLSSSALDDIYTALPTVTAKTITVSGNYGTTGDNPAIATAKGWTVV